MNIRCSPDGLQCHPQSYTECCIYCGHNVYKFKEEYLKELEKADLDNKIKKLENKLKKK